jgi:hypothetical protein
MFVRVNYNEAEQCVGGELRQMLHMEAGLMELRRIVGAAEW